MSQREDRQYVRTWDQIKAMLSDGAYYAGIEKAAAHTTKPIVSPDDAVRAIVGCVIDNPYLGKCHELSLVFAAIQSVRTGLPIGKPLDLAYLVPRWNNGLKAMWAYFSPSYMGLITVARRSGEVPYISASVVRERDHFEWQEGTEPRIDHRPAKDGRGAITHAYAVARVTGSPLPLVAVLDADEIAKRRAIADALKRDADSKNSWDKWEREMSQKSAVVALSHFLPRSPEFGFALFAEQQFAVEEHDNSLVGELGAMLDAKLLPASGASPVDVEERVAAKAAELAAVPVAAPASAPEPLALPLDGAPDEPLYLGVDGARALMAEATNVHGKHVDQWAEGAMTRAGVDSLQFLTPADARKERELLARAERRQFAT